MIDITVESIASSLSLARHAPTTDIMKNDRRQVKLNNFYPLLRRDVLLECFKAKDLSFKTFTNSKINNPTRVTTTVSETLSACLTQTLYQRI